MMPTSSAVMEVNQMTINPTEMLAHKTTSFPELCRIWSRYAAMEAGECMRECGECVFLQGNYSESTELLIKVFKLEVE